MDNEAAPFAGKPMRDEDATDDGKPGGKPELKGWILDVQPDYADSAMTVWVRKEKGVVKVVDEDYRPPFFVGAGSLYDLRELAGRLRSLDVVRRAEVVERKTELGSPALRKVLEVTPRGLGDIKACARMVDRWGDHHRYRLYNVDLRLSQRYLTEKGLFPLARVSLPDMTVVDDDPFRLRYELPPLRESRLLVGVDSPFPTDADPVWKLSLDDAVMEGHEADMLRELMREVRRRDPDIITTEGGDEFVISYLHHRARVNGLGGRFYLGREAGKGRGEMTGEGDWNRGRSMARGARGVRWGGGAHGQRSGPRRGDAHARRGGGGYGRGSARGGGRSAAAAEGGGEDDWCGEEGVVEGGKKEEGGNRGDGDEEEQGGGGRGGTSYFSYGQIVYKPPARTLRGRLHIDTSASFLYREGGMHGLMDLSRLCGIPPQTLSRLSPGTAISAMQVGTAMRDGCLIPWKKNLPEGFKTMEELVVADRGGLIFEPEVGLHQGVLEVDFTSLYPNIMSCHNISPETILCDCCPGTGDIVPELGYHLCKKRTGLIPRVVRPLIHRRMAFKRMVRREPDMADSCKGRSDILKWVLVTCFGYTGYRNARFGRIECHESINAFGRDILVRTMRMAEEAGYRVLHGIVDSLWLLPERPMGRDDHRRFSEDVSARIGIPLEVEGVYRWLVFLPNKGSGTGALNRYYGLFESGELKLRGIELRKHDTPQLIRDAQTEMLDVLSQARDAQGFRERIPAAVDVLRRYASRLMDGTCDPGELVLTRRVSRELSEYTQRNDQTAALEQLERLGHHVNPGQRIRFVICDSSTRDPMRRVKVAQLLSHEGGWRSGNGGGDGGDGGDGGGNGGGGGNAGGGGDGSGGGGGRAYDARRYLELLARAGETLLAPFGWSDEKLLQIFLGDGGSVATRLEESAG